MDFFMYKIYHIASLTAVLSPEAHCLNFANSRFFRVVEDSTFLDEIHFGCQAKEKMFYTHHCEGIVREAAAILEFSIHYSTCSCVILCLHDCLCPCIDKELLSAIKYTHFCKCSKVLHYNYSNTLT